MAGPPRLKKGSGRFFRRAEIILIAEKNVANADERLRLHIFDPLAPAGDVDLEPEAPAAARPVTADARKRALAERHDLKALQTSMAGPYLREPMRTSGARYQRVTTSWE